MCSYLRAAENREKNVRCRAGGANDLDAANRANAKGVADARTLYGVVVGCCEGETERIAVSDRSAGRHFLIVENVLGPFAAPFQTVLAQNILKSCVEFVTIAIRMPGYVGARGTRARRTETRPDGKGALQ